MNDKLVKRLWECASGECFNCSQYTPTTNASVCQKEMMKQAANAIEEQQAAEKKYLANISALETENQHLKREREWMPVASTRDFNTVTSDLIRHLYMSCQRTDGEIWWYDGTLEVLVEFLSILHQKAEEGET